MFRRVGHINGQVVVLTIAKIGACTVGVKRIRDHNGGGPAIAQHDLAGGACFIEGGGSGDFRNVDIVCRNAQFLRRCAYKR